MPVIMVTAKAAEKERVKGFALGADDYVVKPFSPRELLFRVKAVLKRSERKDLGGSEPLSFTGDTLVVDRKGHKVWLL